MTFPVTRWSRLRASLEEVPFDDGATVIERGNVEDWLFVVAEGRIRVHIGDRTLTETGPGGVVGEFALLAPGAAIGIGDRGRAQPAAPPPAGTVRGVARRPSGDRTRRDLDAGADAAGRRRRPSRDGRGVTERRTHRTSRPRGRIVLLAEQAFALGLTAAWIMIPASAIFLAAYGSELLPPTYIAAAVAGVLSSTLLAAALRRRPLASVATASWPVCRSPCLLRGSCSRRSDADWVSFALLVLVPIMVPVGFVFVVGQAGMLLDVRVLKKLYARVVAGFALGFVAGGLAGPLLLTVLGTTETCSPRRRPRPRVPRSWSRRPAADIRRSSR